jgi:hypothetical protein
MRRDLPALIDALRPQLIVSLGLWPGEAMLRIERMAANWSWFELPDAKGHRQNGRVIDGGPDGYLSSLPADMMQAAIRAAGLPCRQSGSAGTYLCNATLYTVLHQKRRRVSSICPICPRRWQSSWIRSRMRARPRCTSVPISPRCTLMIWSRGCGSGLKPQAPSPTSDQPQAIQIAP